MRTDLLRKLADKLDALPPEQFYAGALALHHGRHHPDENGAADAVVSVSGLCALDPDFPEVQGEWLRDHDERGNVSGYGLDVTPVNGEGVFVQALARQFDLSHELAHRLTIPLFRERETLTPQELARRVRYLVQHGAWPEAVQ